MSGYVATNLHRITLQLWLAKSMAVKRKQQISATRTQGNTMKQELRVGKFKTAERGGFVVFDPEMQIPDTPFVFLYVLNSNNIKFYRMYWARKELLHVKTQKENQVLKATYLDWKEANGHKLISLDLKERLRTLATDAEPRKTWCWSCKTKLSNINSRVCLICGWFVCPTCDSCEPNCEKDHFLLE